MFVVDLHGGRTPEVHVFILAVLETYGLGRGGGAMSYRVQYITCCVIYSYKVM